MRICLSRVSLALAAVCLNAGAAKEASVANLSLNVSHLF